VSLTKAGYKVITQNEMSVLLPDAWKTTVPDFGKDVDVIRDSSGGDKALNFDGMHGNLIYQSENQMKWTVFIPGHDSQLLPLDALAPGDKTTNQDTWEPGAIKRIMANTNFRDKGLRGDYFRLIGIDEFVKGNAIWYGERHDRINNKGSEEFYKIPQIDMVNEEDAVPEVNGEELKGRTVKLKVSQRGQKYGVVQEFKEGSPEDQDYTVKVTDVEEPLKLKRTDFQDLPELAEEDGLPIEDGKVWVLHHDDVSPYRVVASGKEHGWEIVLGYELDHTGKDVSEGVLKQIPWNTILTGDELKAINGHDKADLSQAQKLTLILDRRRAAFKRLEKKGLDHLGLVPEEWEHWKKSEFATTHLTDQQKALGMKLHSIHEELDTATAGLSRRDMIMRHNFKQVKNTMVDYGRKLAGKAKQLGQLEYKVIGLPCEASEHATKNEELRLGDFARIQEAAKQHQQDVAKYMVFAKEVEGHQREGWSDINHLSKTWASKVAERRKMRAAGSEEWQAFNDGDEVQIRTVRGEITDPYGGSHWEIGYIGKLEVPQWSCTGFPEEKPEGAETPEQQCDVRNSVLHEEKASNFQFKVNDDGSGGKLCTGSGHCECCELPVHKNALGQKIRDALKVKIRGVKGDADKEVDVWMTDLATPGRVIIANSYKGDKEGEALGKIQGLRAHLVKAITALQIKGEGRTPEETKRKTHLEGQIKKLDTDAEKIEQTMNEMRETEHDVDAQYDNGMVDE